MKHDWRLLTETVLSNHGAAGDVIDCIKKNEVILIGITSFSFGGDEESRTPVRTHCPMNLSERRPCSVFRSVFVQGQTEPIQPGGFPQRPSGPAARYPAE